MAEFNAVYARARYYDIAFRRDVTRELDFLAELFLRRTGRPMRRFLELACGPGYHVRGLARRGVTAIGLDLRPEMIDFAKDEAAKDGVSAQWIVGDMRDFRLDTPVDVIATLYDSLDCLLTNDELTAHFRTVAANLVRDGVYVVEMSHPRDCSPLHYGDHSYSGESDGVKVRIDWAVGGPRVDLVAQVTEMETVMTVEDHGAIHEFKDTARERFALPQEYALLAERSGAMRMTAVHGALDFGQPFDMSPQARRLVMIFERTE